MRLTTEFKVEGFEGSGGGSDEETEVAAVDVGLDEEVDEVPERAAFDQHFSGF